MTDSPLLPPVFASIDDAGDYVILGGPEVTLGHAGSGKADILLLGDLDPIHACFRSVESFHGGQVWRVFPGTHGSKVVVEGETLAGATDSMELVDGTRIELGTGFGFTARAPDPSSASIVLEFSRGASMEGAPRAVLMVDGPAGRVRVGPKRRRHVPIPGLKADVNLVLLREPHGSVMEIQCDAGVREAGRAQGGGLEVRIGLPLSGRVDLSFGVAPERLPPFGIALRPPRR